MESHVSPELLKQAMELLQDRERLERFDGEFPGSRANSYQQTIIDDFTKTRIQIVKAGNQSGKTATGARLVAHMLAETLPGWKRPDNWSKAPLLILAVGRVSTQVEKSLYSKIKAHFKNPLEELKEVRQGGMLQQVVHRATGNTILFASHHNDNEAREKLQSFVAHMVWLDEMPGTLSLFEELLLRVQANRGYFIATFTPKVRNEEIRKWVDNLKEPYGKVYQLPMKSNPRYASAEAWAEIEAKYETYSEAFKNCIFYGDWMSAETAVYEFDSNKMVREPVNYHAGWRHVASEDPALQSKHGQVVFAECPDTHHWYVVMADYIEGIYVPEDLVKKVNDRIAHLRIVRRVADAASTWFIGQASKMGFAYNTAYDKNNRKPEMMKNLQAALGQKLFIAPWCDRLVTELGEMQWSETAADKIINVHKYHLHDAAMYGLDCLPKPEATPSAGGFWQMIDGYKKETIKRSSAKASGATKRGHTSPSLKVHRWR